MSTITLPNVPSRLIKLALQDLQKCEGDPRYMVDMQHWHARLQTQRARGGPHAVVCRVCLAGAVMAQTLEFPVAETAVPGDTCWSSMLMALDAFRGGDLTLGLHHLGLSTRAWEQAGYDLYIAMPNYGLAPDEFKAAMLEIANKMEALGL